MEDTILIKLGVSYKEGMSSDELYHATSVSWKISETRLKSMNFRYYCAVYNNKIKEVYQIIDYKKDTLPENKGRLILEGKLAEPDLRDKLVELDVSVIHTSSGNPIKYTSINRLLYLKEHDQELAKDDQVVQFDNKISKELWEQMLKNSSIFKESDLEYLETIYRLGGEATATQLAKSLNKHFSSFNKPVVDLSKRILDKTDVSVTKREDGKPRYWFVLFNGEYKDNSHFTWKLKPNLKEAMSHIFYKDIKVPFGKEEFLEEVFIFEDDYKNLASLLAYKKNIILQGPPGVGKTFVAKSLAYSLMGIKDDERVEVVQFHQNYSYEDFVMGYRPSEKGFRLETGIFYDFCKRAEKNLNEDYYFVIDEINRGNLSKIFGELFMLVERDKRNQCVTMGYSKKKISVPSNIYIIGTMNTSDRSLAHIEIALRRRFAFYKLKPAFNEKWKNFMLDRGVSIKMVERISSAVQRMNSKIEGDLQLGKGYEIGHSFFTSIPEPNEDEASWFNTIMEFEIRPLLEEYFFDRIDEVDLLLEGL
ncbi:AAA family ATPase [Guptibacillus hwajinpoensis]|uniref:Transcriptional regulator n=1 Tax=Guptibacillus hwajinpoensis TaxID=208199 RepID=A0ABU0JYU3_9BACL|nr:AAA family ATPase [Alkalihalobacillus hemicentroti]MDQ0481077.1 putative transcriptional regulator [Alkalihalobacillus hemicentroti]